MCEVEDEDSVDDGDGVEFPLLLHVANDPPITLHMQIKRIKYTCAILSV